MNINQLRYFIEVYRQGSISSASDNLYISIPALSKSISNLEKELNTTLFIRSAQGIVPTENGKRFFDACQTIINTLDEYQQFVTEQTGNSITIIAYNQIKITFLPDLYQMLNSSFPSDFFDIKCLSLSQVENHFSTESFIQNDVYIFLSEINSIDAFRKSYNIPNDYTIKKLGTAQLMVVMSKTHPLAKADKISKMHLENYPCVALSFIKNYEEPLENITNKHIGILPKSVYYAEAENIYLDFLLSKNAVSYLYDADKIALLKEANLIFQTFDHPITLNRYIIYNKKSEKYIPIFTKLFY